MDLSGKTIFVTGAAGIGVGAGVCQAVDAAGGRLIINDLTTEAVERACSLYKDAIPLVGSVADSASVAEMFARLGSQGIILDGLVNNAGVGLTKNAHEVTEAEFDRLQSVDLKGVWLMSREFTHHCLKHGRAGSIVNISSIHALLTAAPYAVYASAKAGVEGLTRGLAVELGQHHIRCNAIAPGYVHSEQGLDLIRAWTDDPEGWVRRFVTTQQVIERQIEPIDCGWTAVFLLSDFSRTITGQVIRVDAGKSAMVYNKDFQ